MPALRRRSVTSSSVLLERFCGDALFPVQKVTPFLSSAPSSDGGTLLNLELECGPAIEEKAPEAERIGRRGLACEVWIPIEDATLASLEDLRVKVPWRSLDARGVRHSLYVFEHEDLWAIDVRIRHDVAQRFHLRLKGRTRDPNHYSGGVPETQVIIDAVFDVELRARSAPGKKRTPAKRRVRTMG